MAENVNINGMVKYVLARKKKKEDKDLTHEWDDQPN